MISLLASCVPDVEGALLSSADLHGLRETARIDCADLLLVEVAPAKPEGERGLPHTRYNTGENREAYLRLRPRS